jgi:hypothetical protein
LAGFTRRFLRNGFNAYIALSPVTGLSCHRRLQITTCILDTSVGASGPHDFAVRFSAIRPHECADAAASIASNPASVTIAIRPSVGSDGRSCRFDLPDARSGIFFRRGLDTKIAEVSLICPSGKSVRAVISKKQFPDEGGPAIPGPNYNLDVCLGRFLKKPCPNTMDPQRNPR